MVRKVSKEVVALANDPPEGIKVFLNEEDITDIQATIEGPCEWVGKSPNYTEVLVFTIVCFVHSWYSVRGWYV